MRQANLQRAACSPLTRRPHESFRRERLSTESVRLAIVRVSQGPEKLCPAARSFNARHQPMLDRIWKLGTVWNVDEDEWVPVTVSLLGDTAYRPCALCVYAPIRVRKAVRDRILQSEFSKRHSTHETLSVGRQCDGCICGVSPPALQLVLRGDPSFSASRQERSEKKRANSNGQSAAERSCSVPHCAMAFQNQPVVYDTSSYSRDPPWPSSSRMKFRCASPCC
jgi:hypothetical protein